MSDNQNVLIEVHDLKKHYREGTIHALDGVSMDICRGEVIVIVGPSGSGKSTFLRSLNLLELPTSGEIVFDGVDINAPHANINKHRQKMGMVFQHFNLFPNMTVLRNMTIGPQKLLHKSKAEAEEKARKLAGKVLKVTARGAEGGRLYGSVTSQELAEALDKQYGVKVEKRRIESANIRNAGEYKVSVWLYAGIKVEMTAVVEVAQ